MTDFDIEAFKIKPDQGGVITLKPSRPRRRRGQFVMVPMVWVDRLATAKLTATGKVALRLLSMKWKSGLTVKLANAALAEKGVTARQKSRALLELEQLGLVAVKRYPRKSPWVTIILDPT